MARLQDRRAADTSAAAGKRFKVYAPGYIHIDIKHVPQMPDEASRRYRYVAIDRTTRWVHLEILPDQRAATAAAFLKHLCRRAALRLRTRFTDNAKAFTGRFCATGERDLTAPMPSIASVPGKRSRIA